MSEKNQKLWDYIANNLDVMPKQLSEMFNITHNSAKTTRHRVLKSLDSATISSQPTSAPRDKTDTEVMMEDLTIRRLKAQVSDAKKKYDNLLEHFEEGEKRFDALLGIKEPIDISPIQYAESTDKSEAIPIISLSDWHFEERVDSANINGLNEFTPEIASFRWVKCIQNSLKLIYKERNNVVIEDVILWFGGDFITGYIHEELEESNYMSPTQATRFAKEKLVAALNFYIEHGKFKNITVVCSFGNHGRLHKRPRISTGYKNSYEWMMYKDIQDMFSTNDKVKFIVPDGLFAYVNVYDKTLRFWHGDTIKYGGGIGGLTIPLIKAIQRYDQQIHADYNFIGHFHQYFQATKNCIVNGSGIGFNAYAQSIGASPEEPTQSFCLIDKKNGLTIKAPIFCK